MMKRCRSNIGDRSMDIAAHDSPLVAFMKQLGGSLEPLSEPEKFKPVQTIVNYQT